MTDSAGVPQNVEGAPTLVYEVWSWVPPFYYSTREYPLGHSGYWAFIGYRTLTWYRLQQYLNFGYHVERSHRSDRTGTLPLFPRMVATAKDQGNGLD